MPRPLILVQVPGSALEGSDGASFSAKALSVVVNQIKDVKDKVRLVVLLGGSNIVQGEELSRKLGLKSGLSAHTAGMLATVVNALILHQMLDERKVKNEVFIAQRVYVPSAGKQYREQDVLDYFLGEVPGAVALLAGGTGESGLTTDFATVLRGHQLRASRVIKGIRRVGLDIPSTAFAEDHKIPVTSCDILEEGSLAASLEDQKVS